MSIDVQFAHLNVGPKASIRPFNIKAVADIIRNGGVGTLNEVSGQSALIKRLPGIDAVVVGANAVIWDQTRFEKVDAVAYKIMQGGYVGADGVATKKKGDDDRRVGPNRYVVVVRLKDKASGIVFVAGVLHLVAKADTQHKWRRALRAASIEVAGFKVNRYAKNDPGVLIGDTNYLPRRRLNFPHLDEIELPLKGTYNSRLPYDRAYIWGNAKLKPGTLRTFKRRSDHLGIIFTVTFDGPSTPPKPQAPAKPAVKPRPRVKKKYDPRIWRKSGAPVKHPFATRSERWKRRNRKLWNRIVAFRARWRKQNR